MKREFFIQLIAAGVLTPIFTTSSACKRPSNNKRNIKSTLKGSSTSTNWSSFDLPDNIFLSISALKNFPLNQLDKITNVRVLGYYEPGDGGGGAFYWDPGSTETGNGGTIIEPTYSEFEGTGRWKRPDQNLGNVKNFGIGFSEKYNEEDRFYQLLNNFDSIYIPEDTTIKLGTSTSYSTDVIGNKTITGEGNTSVIEHKTEQKKSSTSFPLHLRGQQIKKTSLSNDAFKNNDKLVVNDCTDVSVGDLVFVMSDNKRESSQILDIEGETIVLADRLYRSYQATGSVVTFYHQANIQLKDFRMKFYSDNFSEAIRLEYGIDCDVSGIEITRDRGFAEFAGGAGIYIRNGYNCSVHHNKIEWMNHTSRGYGILVSGCRNCDFTANKIENCRSFDISAVESDDDSEIRFDDCFHCLIQGNTIISKYNNNNPNSTATNTTRGLSTHRGAHNCTFQDNLIIGVFYYILDRGKNNTFKNNTGFNGSQVNYQSTEQTFSINNKFEIEYLIRLNGNIYSKGDVFKISKDYANKIIINIQSHEKPYTYENITFKNLILNIENTDDKPLEVLAAGHNFNNHNSIKVLDIEGELASLKHPAKEVTLVNAKIQPTLSFDIDMNFKNIIPDFIPGRQEFFITRGYQIDQDWDTKKELHLTFEYTRGFDKKDTDFFTLDVSVNMFNEEEPLKQLSNKRVSGFKNTLFCGLSNRSIDLQHITKGPRYAYGSDNEVELQAVAGNRFKVKLKRDGNNNSYSYTEYTACLVFQATAKINLVNTAFE